MNMKQVSCSKYLSYLYGYTQLVKIMKTFLKLFDSQLDRVLDIECYLDCRSPPNRLISDLKTTSQVKKLIKAMDSSSTNPFKYIRLLSLCNLLLIYGKDWFSFIEDKLKYKKTHDDWLNSKFIQPYLHFLGKCCTSKDQYNDAKNGFCRKGQALEALFYSINMLKLLFRIVQKMPFLGRYYKPSHNQSISSAVEIIALQAQKLYGFFKHALTEILYRRQYYIKSKDDELIMRGVLADQLITINQQMKKLFLDKYFYPLGRGIGVKLFRPEEQSPQFEKVIHSIVSNHQQTERVKRHEQLQKTLFPGFGQVNWNFYEQTLLAAPLNITCREQPTYKNLEDMDISLEDESQMKQKQIKKFSKDKQLASDKQTNTGTIQVKGNQL